MLLKVLKIVCANIDGSLYVLMAVCMHLWLHVCIDGMYV